MAASKDAQRRARELFELKQGAVEFYKENKVPEKLEAILNSMIYENPPDVYGRLSEYFETISKPVAVSKIEAHQVLDGRGQPTLQADVYCIVKGLEKYISSSTMGSFNHLSESATVEQREAECKERRESVAAAIQYIQSPIADAISGLQPTQQKQADDILLSIINKLKDDQAAADEEEKSTNAVDIPSESKIEVPKVDTKQISAKNKKKSGSAKSATVVVHEPREPMFCGCGAVCVVSQAMTRAAAEIKGVPLYTHIDLLCNEKESTYQFSFPIPMMTVLSSGKPAPGKQNLIREVLLIPRPDMSYKESLEMMTKIYHQVTKIYFSKVGVAAYFTNEFGSICPQYDKPDQVMDHVSEAIAALELTAGQDVYLGLNCAAHEIYDPDKAKYEMMTGTFKTGDDMVDVYGDILNRYPGVIALIDPLRKHDTGGYQKLCSQFSARCLIIGDQVYPRPEKFLLTGFDSLLLNGATLRLQQMTSVTDLIKSAQLIQDSYNVTVVAGVQGDVTDTFLADMAVGVKATFVKFGAPNRGERVLQYNRLSRIADELAANGALVTRTEFPFRAIHQPEPQEDDIQT